MMNIRLLKRQDIDTSMWNQLITKSKNADIYGLSWYLDAVTDSSWSALVMDGYTAAMPVYIKKKWGLQYITQAFMCQYCSIYGASEITSDLVYKFLNAIRGCMIKTEFNFCHTVPEHLLQRYSVTAKYNQSLSLGERYEDIRKSYNRSTIRNIRKSQNLSVIIRYDYPPLEVYDYIVRHDVSGWMKIHEASGKQLVSSACEHTSTVFQTALSGDEIIGAGIFFFDRNRIYWLMSAISNTGRAYSIMFRMLDEFVRQYSGKGYTLDFCGSSIPDVAQRNRGFGADTSKYYHLKKKLF
jgi:hypothetical protein